jgi:hypothetical protein
VAASDIVSTVTPLVSVFVGAGLTYWFNVRMRRQNFVEDLFNEAVTAVAVADASKHYLRSVAQPPALPDRQYRELLADIAKTAIENHTRRTGEAREAIARVMQYESRVKPFYEDAQAVVDHPNEIISLLVEARTRFSRTRVRRSKRLAKSA